MIHLEDLLSLQGQLFLLALLGMIFRRCLITEAGQKGLTTLLVDLILPCNIILSFQIEAGSDLIKQASVTFLASAFVQCGCWILAKVLFRRCPQDKRAVLQYSTLCSNAGFLGTALAEGLFARNGVLLASIYLIPQRIMMWTVGLHFFVGKQEKSWKKVLWNPCLIAVAIGILLLVCPITLPALLQNTVACLGKCNTGLSMFMVGMMIAHIDLRNLTDPLILFYSAIRLGLIPFLVYTADRLLGLDGLSSQISLLLSAMPAGATSALLAEKYDGDAQFAASCVTVSTALSLIATPLWCTLM